MSQEMTQLAFVPQASVLSMLSLLFPQSRSALVTRTALPLPSFFCCSFPLLRVASEVYGLVTSLHAAHADPDIPSSLSHTSCSLSSSLENCTTNERPVLPPHLPFMSPSPPVHGHGSGGYEPLLVHHLTIKAHLLKHLLQKKDT